MREGAIVVSELEDGLCEAVLELAALKERLALTVPEEDQAVDLEQDEEEADLQEMQQLQNQQAEGLKIIEETKEALVAMTTTHNAERKALEAAREQLALLEKEEHELNANVAEVTTELCDTERRLATLVEQEDAMTQQLSVYEEASATAERHLEHLTEVSLCVCVCACRWVVRARLGCVYVHVDGPSELCLLLIMWFDKTG